MLTAILINCFIAILYSIIHSIHEFIFLLGSFSFIYVILFFILVHTQLYTSNVLVNITFLFFVLTIPSDVQKAVFFHLRFQSWRYFRILLCFFIKKKEWNPCLTNYEKIDHLYYEIKCFQFRSIVSYIVGKKKKKSKKL